MLVKMKLNVLMAIAALLIASPAFTDEEEIGPTAIRGCRGVLHVQARIQTQDLRKRLASIHQQAFFRIHWLDISMHPVLRYLNRFDDAEFYFKISDSKVQHAIVFVPPQSAGVIDQIRRDTTEVFNELIERKQSLADDVDHIAISAAKWSDPQARPFWEKCLVDPFVGICMLGFVRSSYESWSFVGASNEIETVKYGTVAAVLGAFGYFAARFNLRQRANDLIRRRLNLPSMMPDLLPEFKSISNNINRWKLNKVLLSIFKSQLTSEMDTVTYLVATRGETAAVDGVEMSQQGIRIWHLESGIEKVLADAGYVSLDQARKMVKPSSDEPGDPAAQPHGLQLPLPVSK